MANYRRSGATIAPRVPSDSSFYALIALVFAGSAIATFYFCGSMSGGMDMPGGWTMSMMWMRMPGSSWIASAMMSLLMWLAMMVAMMLPSTMPMLLNFRRSCTMGGASRTGVSTFLVACGYFSVWMVVGIVAYAIGAMWAFATMRSAGLSRAVPALTGATVLLGGVLQFTRWKMAGLSRCRDPFFCGFASHGGGQSAALSHGFRQGVSCAVCCSGPMLVLVALGAMDLFVMLAVACVIALEKLLPKPQPVVHLTGLAAIVAGVVLIVRSVGA